MPHPLAALIVTLLVLTLSPLARAADPADSDRLAFARRMGLGWNLGNTLEATGIQGKTVREFETAWGQPVTTKAMFDGVRQAGFKSVRLPVAWSNLIGPAPTYEIHPDLMARVEEVVGYALDNDLVVMINIHWDGGWIKNFATDYDGTMTKYRAIWTQIAERFKGYDDRVVFESMNEEGCFDDLWNRWTNQPDNKSKAYETLNSVNQAFVDLVRASGGGNASRYLLIAGYATDITNTIDPLFAMPRDPSNQCMVSVHYYDPFGFTHLEEDTSWAKAANTWGTPEEVAKVEADLRKVKEHFIDRGIPVVLGEYGCASQKDPASVNKYLTTVTETAHTLGLVPMLWDTGGVFDRETCAFKSPELAKEFARIAASH